MTEVGKNIKAFRVKMGLTQEELAEKVGYKTKSAINKIELGINDLPQKKIVAFAKALETTPAALMGWNEDTYSTLYTAALEMQKEKSPSITGEGAHRIPDEETLKLLELLETREDIRYLAAASQRATPEHVKATAKMFDELYGRKQDE